MGSNPKTNISANQVLQKVYDEANDRLRTDAVVSATVSVTDVEISHVNDSIRLGDGTDLITSTNVSGKQGLDVNIVNDIAIEIDANDGDNVAIVGTEDGTIGGTKHVAKIGSDLNLRVKDDDANLLLSAIDTNTDQIESKLDTTNSSLSTIDSNITTSNTLLNSINNNTDQLETKIDSSNTLLTSIQNRLPSSLGQTTSANSLSVTLASDQTSININTDGTTATPDSMLLVGSEDASTSGTKHIFVNNLRQKILASHDRDQDITYADFGTKDQRVTQIDYTSSTFPGFTARKNINYTLVGTKYRRDSITWSIV